MKSINLPFPGFYESRLSGGLDLAEEEQAEWLEEKDSSPYEVETFVADEELRMKAFDFADILFDVTDYHAAHIAIAKSYVDAFEHLFTEEFEFPLGLQFEEMVSPREYNFTTDRVFALISEDMVQKLFNVSEDENHVRLAAMIAERFTSRSGFHSFYSNRLSQWLDKPLEDWDCNEIGTLLLALLPEDFETKVVDSMEEDYELFGYAFREAVDWAKFDQKVEERRQELLGEALVLDQGYVPPPRPCLHTADLFKEQR